MFSKVKTDPEPNVEKLLIRLSQVRNLVRPEDKFPVNEFQEWAWSGNVLEFLNSGRWLLDWREDQADRTLMGFILVHLHANHSGLSNMMQNSKALGPDYAVRWWKSKNMVPPH